MIPFTHLDILLRLSLPSEKHANKVSHCLNLLPKALSKKCHRPERASQFPETSPVKSALHYIRPALAHPSAPAPPLCLFHRLIFFCLTFLGEELSEIAAFDPTPSCLPQKHSSNHPSFKHVRLAKSGPVPIDLLCLYEREKQKACREDDTPAESSINTKPGYHRMVSGFLPRDRGDLETSTSSTGAFTLKAGHQGSLGEKNSAGADVGSYVYIQLSNFVEAVAVVFAPLHDCPCLRIFC